ncbi:MAG: TRAP transporter small permease subunit [Gammaproteobacteria bacterium]|nr:TRAP transporter small permease subunit [Gammaproteobacteria bacterium]
MLRRLTEQAEESVISLLLVAMTLLVFYEVILRFGFGTGLSWGQEATLHLSAWFVLFGASYGIKVGAHIGVDAFVRLLPPLGQRLISALAILLSLVYCGLFLYGSWVYLAKMHLIGIELEDIPIPAWLAHGILLVGFALLSLRLLGLLYRVARGSATGFQKAGEAEQSLRLADELKRDEAESNAERAS